MTQIPPRRPLVDAPTPASPPLTNNPMGIAGFVTSLVGLPTCGFISPIGLVLSIFGLFKQPKGLAIAGTIVGAIGTVFLGVVGYGVVMTMVGIRQGVQSFTQVLQTQGSAQKAYVAIEAARKSAKALPNDQAGSVIAARYADAWSTPMRYKIEEDSYIIISAGPDKKFDTDDDVEFMEDQLKPPTTNMTQPVTEEK